MVGKIIGLVSCLMCAFPFLIISVYNKDSREPINFWSGDTTLKSKVKNVVEYNKKTLVCIDNDRIVGTSSFCKSRFEQFNGWGESYFNVSIATVYGKRLWKNSNGISYFRT